MTSLKDFGYEEIKVVGRGQYGKAHLTRKEDGHYIAKTIDLTCLSSKERETALQEVALLRRLDHPNIVEYKDNFFMADTLVIVMQYCEGGDLATYIKEKVKERRRIQEVQIMHYFVQILQALSYIHNERILHRDLKSSNLFLMRSKEVVKLGDFGISRVLEGSLQAAVTVVGTPYYMSPEVCENKPYSFKSDVWSLGCVLYELCMLKHAFSADNLLGLVYKIVSDKYEPIPKRCYTSNLNGLIERTLEKDDKKRPSVQNLLEDSYVRTFMQDYLRTRGKSGRQGTARRDPGSKTSATSQPQDTTAAAAAGGSPVAASPASGANDAAAAAAPAAAPAQQQPRPQRAPRVTTRTERGAGARAPGGAAPAGGGASKARETPKEAAARRRREENDRRAAELKAAAQGARQNNLVAKQLKESEFQSTRLGRGVIVSRQAQQALASPMQGSVSTTVPESQQEGDEYYDDDDESYSDEDDSYSDEYEDDFDSEPSDASDAESDGDDPDEDQGGGGGGEGGRARYVGDTTEREQEDFSRVMANYEQDVCRNPGDAAAAAAALPPVEEPVGQVPGAVMNMKTKAQHAKNELMEKMGAETFQKIFGYLLEARSEQKDEKIVKRELQAMVGPSIYKKYCFDVDQLVYLEVHMFR